jgi:acyl transferase domain-containing protein/NADPH:quinone reductase-like Zn-dependent oxidoreductase/acyl carrier protein
MPPSDRFANLSPLKQALLTMENLEQQVQRFELERSEPIAIVGMGCRFPHANNPEHFWELLQKGGDAVSEVPAVRWPIEDFYDPNPDTPGKMSTRWGGFLDAVDGFDPEFFGISPREAVSMDPQQRLMLEVVWEALENAGQGPQALQQGRTGVFVGISSDEFLHRFFRAADLNAFSGYFASGIARSVAGGRVSYTLGIQGPNLAIDTACSSSLVAIHTACLYLRTQQCRMALAGGVNVILSPEIGIAFSKSHMMAADGRCKAFDSRADGFVRGEGCGIVVLKRLSDALADGDRILALIRGSAVNQDGRSSGLTVPNLSAQQAVIRQALADGSVEPAEVGFVEAHGTGTALGDPIEARALATVLGSGRAAANPLVVGSVKTNLGHLEAAAGVAGLIKAVLSLHKEAIPPHLHFRAINPHIDWGSMPVEIPSTVKPWPRGERRRIAAVSAFGFSGTNAHVVLEEAPKQESPTRVIERPLQLMALSAKSETALTALAQRHAQALATSSADVGDICHTTNAGRAHFEYRLTAVGKASEEIRAGVLAALPGKRVRERDGVRAVFLFPGQGAQYAGMGEELYATQPVFRKVLDECAAGLVGQMDVSLLDVLWGSATEKLGHTAFTQPALFAIEYALAKLWQSWGIEPAVVLGHSVGEYVAACIASLYSLEDGLKLIAARGRLMQGVSGRGGMLALRASETQARAALAGLEKKVSLAAVNGPTSVVVAGYEEELAIVEQRLQESGVAVQRLTVSHGFHSPQMAEMEEAFERVAAGVSFRAPQVELISSWTGQPARSGELSQPAYWRKQASQPVRFAAAMEALRGYRVFIEVGPGTTLTKLGRQNLNEADRLWVNSITPNKSEWEQMLESLGHLYVTGADVNWEGFDAPYGRQKVDLPTYPFQRQRYWIETKERAAETGGDELLGRRVEVAGSTPIQVWESQVSTARQTYLADHRALGNAIFPLTGYLEMAVEAAGPQRALEDIVLREPMVVTEEDRTVQVVARGDVLEIYSRDGEKWKQHFSARAANLEPASGGKHPENLSAAMQRMDDVRDFYAFTRGRGMDFGPAFRTIRAVWTASAEAIVRVAADGPAAEAANLFNIHPAVLDGCFQSIGVALPEGNDDLYLPARLERFQQYRRATGDLWAHAVRRPAHKQNTTTFDIYVWDKDGRVADARGMEFVRVPARRVIPMFAVRWKAQPFPAAEQITGDWLILADQAGFGAELAIQLSALGAKCVLLQDASYLKAAVAENNWKGIVHLWSLDAPPTSVMDATLLDAAQRMVCGSALDLVHALANSTAAPPPRLWLVTRGARSTSTSQEKVEVVQAMLWGMANAITEEHPEWSCARVDLDPAASSADARLLCAEIAGGAQAQVAFRGEERLVSRIALSERKPDPAVAKKLSITTRGSLDALEVEPATRHRVPPGCVEIEVRATGVNFRDVLNVLGMFTGLLGSECVGSIVAVGESVEGFAEGDEVIAFVAGSHDGYVIADARLVTRQPSNLTAVQAATLPTAFLTSAYTLQNLAKIRRGDRVLIHAGTGGVGLAAVQIAQRAGAEVFATAGNDRKRAFLRNLGVTHIFDSRTLDFAREILEITGGKGIDIVLNSLAGDFIGASFSVLARGGRFIEIGKRDIWSAERVAELGKDIQYYVVDLGTTAIEEPDVLGGLLNDLVRAVEAGELRPLPATVFTFDEAADGYRYMAQARHIGKVVLSQSQCMADILPQATYLITGGFGGIGSQLLRWLVRRGARNVVLVGRRAPGDSSLQAIAWAEAHGARVEARLADVANQAEVAALLAEIAAGMPRLRGVLHAAGTIDDGVLTQQNWDRFARVLAPKAMGSWLLHELTAARPLDFFVMFSSVASILGAAGQANYAAANAFEDALAHERHRLGLPAASINWGAWAEGMAVNDGFETRRRRLGLEAMSVEEGLGVLDYVSLGKPTQIGAGLIQWSKIPALYAVEETGTHAAAPAAGREGTQAEPASETSLLDRLAGASDARGRALLFESVLAIALRVLGFPAGRRIDSQQPLNELGLDSLMAVEFRNMLASEVRQNLPSTLLFNYPTLDDVVAYVGGLLFGAEDDKPSAAPPHKSSRDPLEFIEDLSDEDVEKLLTSKLGASHG